MQARKFVTFSTIFYFILFSILIAYLLGCKSLSHRYNPSWSKEYLASHPEISTLIDQYQAGVICPEFRTLRTDTLNHAEMAAALKEKGYQCTAKPLYVLPNGEDGRLLTKSGGSTLNPNSKELVYQEIWLRGHCSVHIKALGFPGTRRPHPHANKAIIIKPNEYIFSNEAFKITNDGVAVPKSPVAEEGMVKCSGDPEECKEGIDQLMHDLHPPLKLPTPGAFCIY